MPALSSSLLIVGHPSPENVQLGADFARDADEALRAWPAEGYAVVAVAQGASAVSLERLLSKAQQNPAAQLVLIFSDLEQTRNLHNRFQFFQILPAFAEPLFSTAMHQALDRFSQGQQNAQLNELLQEQNEHLKRLSLELEERIQKRQTVLEEAKSRLLRTNERVNLLQRALVAIQGARSVGEMETLLFNALQPTLSLTALRIAFIHQMSELERWQRQARTLHVHYRELFRGEERTGAALFARPLDRNFNRDEMIVLNHICDTLSLALDRLVKLDASETLKQQWEATFDAISDPLCLVGPNYELQRTNRAFAQNHGLTPDAVVGQKCFKVLFSRSEPCPGCQLGGKFRLRPEKPGAPYFSVSSQRLKVRADSQEVYVNLYEDISRRLRLEKMILESARMAELGTIGSSIAHELNNPLGGMLSFLQLIKMDLPKDTPLYQDISEMEDGAKRCRDIVKNLLGFSRRSSSDPSQIFDLREAVAQAVQITELQTRSRGVRIEQDLGEAPLEVSGDFNLLAQAVRHFLQNAQETEPSKIAVVAQATATAALLEVRSEGGKFRPDAGLGLAVALEILQQHHGQMEISTADPAQTKAKISLPLARNSP